MLNDTVFVIAISIDLLPADRIDGTSSDRVVNIAILIVGYWLDTW
jgi:hypothetical protein